MAFRLFQHIVVGPLQCNCYIIGDDATNEAIVIDPGGDADAIAESIASNALTVVGIVATHAHFDHIVAAERLRELTGAPFYLHDDDKPLLSWYETSARMFLGVELGDPPDVDSSPKEGDRLKVGSVELEVLHTPGHSPGSISLATEDALFSGDTLFAGSIGRTDLPGGDTELLLRMIRNKLFSASEGIAVYPGHGPVTTVEEERRSNPFVGERSRLWLPPT